MVENHGDGHDAPTRKEEREKQNHGLQGKGIIWILFYTQDTIEGVGGLGSIVYYEEGKIIVALLI